MGWVRVSDDYYDHPKFADLGALSVALWIAGLAYCNRNLTDGYISESAARRLVDYDGIAYTVATVGEFGGVMEDDCYPLAAWKLIEANLWHDNNHDCPTCPQPGPRRVYVHDYLVYQPSAGQIKAKHEARSDAGKKGASSRWAGREDVA